MRNGSSFEIISWPTVFAPGIATIKSNLHARLGLAYSLTRIDRKSRREWYRSMGCQIRVCNRNFAAVQSSDNLAIESVHLLEHLCFHPSTFERSLLYEIF